MPAVLATPVLQVDANVIHQVDTTNPDNLFSMWTVFARCADSVHQGRRLENLSWRLWTRETFCCKGVEQVSDSNTTTQPKPVRHTSRSSTSDEIPQLSSSVDSVGDEEAVELAAESAPMEILRPRIRREDSCASSRSRGRERHITSGDLEKMVVSIIQAKEPLSAPLPDISASFPTPRHPKTPDVPALERSGSTTTESPCKSSQTPSIESLQHVPLAEVPIAQSHTMVVRGFSPSSIPTPPATTAVPKLESPNLIPEPTAAPPPRIVHPRKQQATFDLGGSSADDSYSDRGHELEARKQPVPAGKKKMFQVGGSSEEDSSLKSALLLPKQNPQLTAQKKTASFSNQLVTRTFPPAPAEDDQSETDYVDESAIDDDDDSSDWEDSIEESGKSSIDDKLEFQRVDSKANLTTRRSLITLMLAQNDRTQKVGTIASHSTSALSRAARSAHQSSTLVASPNDSDDAPLMMKRGARAPPMRSINEIPRSGAQPIMTTTNGLQHQAALSPRTTRRNMLATELTESLRRHLLRERSQKTSTANAVLKRRHTSHDVANLKQYPEKPFMKKEENKTNDVNASSWDHYFNREAFTGYHSQGW